ncbi:MAG TPA: hypothetical protein DE038_11845 [Nitrospina sp.]|nr:hypothetical protein [Nitrospina sp.]
MPNPREKYLSLKMKLFVERFTSDKDATISAIYLDDVFQCFGLENEYREEKVASETRIAAGSYNGMTSHYRRFSCSIRKKVFRYPSGDVACTESAWI